MLGYDPLQIGLAFLPVTIVMGTLSVRYAERLIMNFGARTTLIPGLVLIGAALFAAGACGRQLRPSRPAGDDPARLRRRRRLPHADDAGDVGRHAE